MLRLLPEARREAGPGCDRLREFWRQQLQQSCEEEEVGMEGNGEVGIATAVTGMQGSVSGSRIDQI